MAQGDLAAAIPLAAAVQRVGVQPNLELVALERDEHGQPCVWVATADWPSTQDGHQGTVRVAASEAAALAVVGGWIRDNLAQQDMAGYDTLCYSMDDAGHESGREDMERFLADGDFAEAMRNHNDWVEDARFNDLIDREEVVTYVVGRWRLDT